MKFTTQITDDNTELSDRIQRMKEEYAKFSETLGKMTLAETWNKLGIHEGTSPNGWPMLSVGEGPTLLCRNTISGINALADLAKYKVLSLHHHLANFNPVVDCDNIKVDYDVNTAQYSFMHWRNFSYVPSAMSRPDFRNWQLKRNYVQKHTALDQFLRSQSKKFGPVTFMVVMNREAELAHYQENVRPYLEKPFNEFLEAERVRWSTANLNRSFTFNNNTSKSSAALTDDRTCILQALTEATTKNVKVKFLVHHPSYNQPLEEEFDPQNERLAQSQINGVMNAAPYVTFELVK
jgi:hypothetical protein